MTGGRLDELVRLLAPSGRLNGVARAAIRQASERVFDTPHCGIIIMDADDHPTAIVSSTALMATIEDLELTLGVGPCLTACHEGVPVAEPDLARADTARWLEFSAAAHDAGAAGAFAFPLVAQGVLGSLNVARVGSGPLTQGQHDDGVALADGIAQLLAMQVTDGGWDIAVDGLMHYQAVVHQATGMVAAQLDVPMSVGLAVLRARAFAEDRPIAQLAADVVGRDLRFDEST